MSDDFSRFKHFTGGLGKNIHKALLRAVLYLERMVEEEAPKVTGNLVNHISSYVVDRGQQSYGIVALGAKYTGYVIRGTGIYGPYKQRIRPVRKKALAFSYGGAQVVVRSVAGQRPNPFHLRARKKALPKLLEIFGGFRK